MVFHIMPSLQPIITISHTKNEHKPAPQSFENVRAAVAPPKYVPYEPEPKKEVELTTVPKNTKIFGANFARELRKTEKKKEKEIEYLPGEKLVIELQKSLQKEKKKKEDKEHISTLTKSINNVIEDLEL